MSAPIPHWHTGVFDICADATTCAMGYWLTPCLHGDNISRLEGKNGPGPCLLYAVANFCCLQTFVARPVRRKIRETFDLPEQPCSDTCIHCWCSPCATCQEAREIKRRSALLTKPLYVYSAYSHPPKDQYMEAS